MLGIKSLDHVSMAAQDLEKQVTFFRQLFGMEVAERFENRGDRFAGAALGIPGSRTRLEVLAPLGEDSFLQRFLQSGGSSLHHLTFEVEDVEAAASVLRDRGIEPFGMRRSHGWRELFIHPRDSGGVLIQLYQRIGDGEEGQG